MINKYYLDNNVKEQIGTVLEKDKITQLHDFFDEKYYKSLATKVRKLDFKRVYNPELCSYSYSFFEDDKFFETMNKFLSSFSDLKLKSAKAFSLKHKDYLMINDLVTEESGIKIIIELTNDWKEEFGGFDIFFIGDDNLFYYPIRNSISIVVTFDDMKRCIKYINNLAKNKSRYFIELEYERI